MPSGWRWGVEAKLSTDGQWVDLSTSVMELSIERGRGYDEDVNAAGRMSVLLDNDDGLFTPGNSGAYSGADVEKDVKAWVEVDPPSPALQSAQRGMGSGAARVLSSSQTDGLYDTDAVVRNGTTDRLWVGSSSVSTGSGFPLAAGDMLSLTLRSSESLWGVTTGTTGPAEVLWHPVPTRFNRFAGRVKALVPRFGDGADRRELVQLEAVDGFEGLDRRPLSYAYRSQLLSLDPEAYWPLDETGEFVSRAKDRSGNGHHGNYIGTPTFGGGATLVTGASPVLMTGIGDAVALNSDAMSLPSQFTVAGWFATTRHANTRERPLFSVGEGVDFNAVTERSAFALRLGGQIGPTRKVNAYVASSTSFASNQTASTAEWGDGTATFVAFVAYSTRKVLWVNGDATTETYASPLDPYPTQFGYIGRRVHTARDDLIDWVGQASSSGLEQDATVGEWAVWHTALSTAQIDDLYAARSGWVADKPGTRIGRVLDLADWSTVDRSLSTGDTPLAALDSDTTVLDHALEAAYADGGVFLMDRNGTARFEGRTDRWVLAPIDTPDMAFDDDATDTRYMRLEFDYSVAQLRNRWEVSGTNVGTATYESTGSVDSYGERGEQITSLSNNESDIASRAEWEGNRWDDPALRVNRIGVAAVSTQAETLARSDLQDVLHVTHRPSGQDIIEEKPLRLVGLREFVSDGGKSWAWEAETVDAADDQPAIFDSTESFSALDEGIFGY